MKKILSCKNSSYKHTVLFAIILLFASNAVAQVVSTNLKAIWYNGKTAIQVANASYMSTYFVSNNGSVDIDFYFSPDDPRNGIHVGLPTIQPNGKINITFADLPYQLNDSLTFIATEIFPPGTPKYYVFVRGNYFPESGGPINTCPRYFTCHPKGITFYFDRKEIILDPSSVSALTLIIPNAGLSITRNLWAIVVNDNAMQIKFIPSLDCSQIMQGIAMLTINGITCTFENGQLTCPPSIDIPGNLSSGCAPYFQNCTLDLIKLLSEEKFTMPCKQWVDYNQCKTTTLIYRQGKVAIGTENFPQNSTSLIVKNGIITDKVKVTNGGWADYVFEPDYTLMPLAEVEAYIEKYQHLPGTPSADQVEAEGSFELGETTINHQVKIEELFLHLIELEEETKAIESVLLLSKVMTEVQKK